MPKLYFYDTGLASSLLGIENSNQLDMHHMKGSLFESMILAELMKHRHNHGAVPNFFFWRDKVGHEIDCILETGEQLIPVEIKSGKTITSDFFKELEYWQKLADMNPDRCYLIYGGEQSQRRSKGTVVSWKEVTKVYKKDGK